MKQIIIQLKNRMEKTYHLKKNLSDLEVITYFPDEARAYLLKNIPKQKRVVAKKKKEIAKVVAGVNKANTDDFTKDYCKMVIKMEMMPELMKHKDILFHQEIQWSLLNPNSKNNYMPNFQQQIELAKDFPIYELARDTLELQPSGANFKALCPFHDEKHASFVIFTATNTFHCFSCGKGGDSINFLTESCGISFIEAVRMISKKNGN